MRNGSKRSKLWHGVPSAIFLLLTQWALLDVWIGYVPLKSRIRPHTVPTSPQSPSLIEVSASSRLLGGTPWKRPIRFLVQGGLHGDEVSTPKTVRWLAERYKNGSSFLRNLDPWGVAIDFLPVANPGGAFSGQRLNPRGVNLNRNFPVLWGVSQENPGQFPLSEPETQAIERLVRDRQYLAAVDIHGYVSWIIGPSYPHEIQKDIKDEFRSRRQKEKGKPLPSGKYKFENTRVSFDHHRVASHREWIKALHQEMAYLQGYELHTAGSLGDGGAFEDWAFWHMGVFAFCLEMGVPLEQDRLEGQRASQQHFLGITPQDETHLIQYERMIANMFMHAIFLNKSSPIVGAVQDLNQSNEALSR